MPDQQVYSAVGADFGKYVKVYWVGGDFVDGSVVPPGQTLLIGALTLNYFPGDSGGVLGRADIAGRDAPDLETGTSLWRLQVVYVEPKKTVHMTFPIPLRLEAGGHVEVGFLDEGPGTIGVDINGILVPA